MRIVATFDPSAVTSDTFNAGFPNGVGRIVVYNESNINLQLSWGSFSTYCPAWTAMLYCISTSNVNINWQQQSTLVSTGAPISQVIVEAFDNNEVIVGTFPAALVRQTNIGNTVTASVGSINTLVNDGNTQTSIIEATPLGAGSSTISIDNEGNVVIKGNNAGVLTTLLQLIAGATPGVKVAAAAVLTEILGTVQIDQNASIRATLNAAISLVLGISADTNRGLVIFGHSATQSGNLLALQTSGFSNVFTVGPTGNTAVSGLLHALANLTADGILSVVGASSLDNGAITTDGAGNITTTGSATTGSVITNTIQDTSGDGVISVTGTGATQNTRLQSGNQINLQVPSGSSIAIIDSAGIHLNAGQLILTDGAMKHIAAASIACGAATTITHGLGTTPRIVTGTPDFAVSGSATVGVGSVGATTFIGDIGAGTNLMWWAVHE